jgi:hypothetical protein
MRRVDAKCHDFVSEGDGPPAVVPDAMNAPHAWPSYSTTHPTPPLLPRLLLVATIVCVPKRLPRAHHYTQQNGHEAAQMAPNPGKNGMPVGAGAKQLRVFFPTLTQTWPV